MLWRKPNSIQQLFESNVSIMLLKKKGKIFRRRRANSKYHGIFEKRSKVHVVRQILSAMRHLLSFCLLLNGSLLQYCSFTVLKSCFHFILQSEKGGVFFKLNLWFLYGHRKGKIANMVILNIKLQELATLCLSMGWKWCCVYCFLFVKTISSFFCLTCVATI